MKAVDFVSRHFKSGGTGFGNFPAKQFDIYAETVRRLGDPRYIISKYPMKGTEGNSTLGALSIHYIGDIEQKSGGTSDFWNLHEKVTAEHALREQARKEKEERNRPKTVQVGDYKVTASLDAAGGLVISAEQPTRPDLAPKKIVPLIFDFMKRDPFLDCFLYGGGFSKVPRAG